MNRRVGQASRLPSERESASRCVVGFADGGRRDARPTLRFMESPHSFVRMHWDHEPVGRVTPCAPQFGNAQTARRGLTRPTFRFMES